MIGRVADSPVEVLLSTFDGAKHLAAFLQSLESQTWQSWTLTVRDDGSSDETIAILRRWGADHPARLRLLDNRQHENLGVVGSFSKLLAESVASHVMLADQDDVWLPGKIALTLRAMTACEARAGAARPTLVHTDLQVVNERLETLSPSLWRFQGLAPGRPRMFSRLMLENVVWGCTAMLNRALVEKLGPLPAELPHHDWWIALVAAALGELVSLPDRPILWRRHGLNESDISSAGGLPVAALSGVPAARQRLDRVLADAQTRVGVFLQRYGGELEPSNMVAAVAFMNLRRHGWLSRRVDLVRHDVWFGSPVRNAGLLALV